MLRFSCSQLSLERLDPVGTPGSLPSPHLHQIGGGDSFNASMVPGDHDPAAMSTCTTCTFSEDFSNYWTAVLYFRARNGTFKRVPQMANQGLTQNGGMTIYYIPSYDGKSKVTAFRPGFRMLVGEPSLRKPAGGNGEIGLCHRCFGKGMNPFGGAPCTGSASSNPPDTATLPSKPCAGGIRTQTTFPTCWDGKNLDSPDHKSHVAYPSGKFENNGVCPTTHPVKIPQLMFETMWDTSQFNDKALWPADGSQPFVFSMGDATGHGNHGDYIFGWKGDSLQKAMDAKCNINCKELKTQSAQAAMKCNKPPTMKENIDGWLTELPGSMPITS